MTPDLERLKAVAEAATPGEWLREGRTVYSLEWAGIRHGVEQYRNRFTAHFQQGPETTEQEAEANAQFTHTFDPPTVLALIAEIERLRGELEMIARHSTDRGAQRCARQALDAQP